MITKTVEKNFLRNSLGKFIRLKININITTILLLDQPIPSSPFQVVPKDSLLDSWISKIHCL